MDPTTLAQGAAKLAENADRLAAQAAELAHNPTQVVAASSHGAGDRFVFLFTVFVLAIFVGFEVITKVPPTLHTPLMSGSNAISGITLVGALLSAGHQHTLLTTILGFVAVVFATINVVGGFLVTNRMLGMFRKKEDR